jgi:hypothetical protein
MFGLIDRILPLIKEVTISAYPAQEVSVSVAEPVEFFGDSTETGETVVDHLSSLAIGPLDNAEKVRITANIASHVN